MNDMEMAGYGLVDKGFGEAKEEARALDMVWHQRKRLRTIMCLLKLRK